MEEVRWYSPKESDVEFSFPGIAVLARIAGLRVASDAIDPARVGRRYAFLGHGLPPREGAFPRECLRLEDGAGVWARLGGTIGNAAWGYCPLRG